jgi:hypothetical protein
MEGMRTGPDVVVQKASMYISSAMWSIRFSRLRLHTMKYSKILDDDLISATGTDDHRHHGCGR